MVTRKYKGYTEDQYEWFRKRAKMTYFGHLSKADTASKKSHLSGSERANLVEIHLSHAENARLKCNKWTKILNEHYGRRFEYL